MTEIDNALLQAEGECEGVSIEIPDGEIRQKQATSRTDTEADGCSRGSMKQFGKENLGGGDWHCSAVMSLAALSEGEWIVDLSSFVNGGEKCAVAGSGEVRGFSGESAGVTGLRDHYSVRKEHFSTDVRRRDVSLFFLMAAARSELRPRGSRT